MHGRACKQCIFRSCNTPTFSTMRFDKTPLTCQSESEDKRAEGFRILLFYWSFSSNILVVKGLNTLHWSMAKKWFVSAGTLTEGKVRFAPAVPQPYWGSSLSSWILTHRQPHRVVSGQTSVFHCRWPHTVNINPCGTDGSRPAVS